MKKIILLFLLCFLTIFCFSQNKMFGNGGWNLNGYTNFWLNSSDTSFLIRGMGTKFPIGTTAQRPVALTATVRWNSDSTRLEAYNGTTWKGISFSGDALTAISIGTSIGSATAKKVFYAGTGGLLQQSTKFTFDSTNNLLGIGKATPAQKLDIGDTSIITTTFQNIASEKAWNNSTADATAQLISYNGNTRLLGTSNYNVSAGSIASFDMAGYNSTLFHSGSGLCGGAMGLRLGVRTTSSGNITNATGIYLNIRNTDTMTNYYGLYVGGNDATTSGWVSNYYALHLGITAGTLGVNPNATWGLYAPNTGMNHYIAGNFGIGQTTTTARLHLPASTSSANTGALKFTSGTPPTTPEIGLMNMINGLWVIDSSNSVRDTIATRSYVRNNSQTALTFSTGLTNTSGTVTNNLSTGVSGGQTLIGSTSTNSGITYKATSGVGTTGADHIFTVGNNGATEAMRINNAARVGIGVNSSTGWLSIQAGTTSVAPLVLNPGTNLSGVQDGAIEYDGTNYFGSVNVTRYTIAKTLTNTATLDFGNTIAGTVSDLTVTVTGAVESDPVVIGVPNGSYPTTGTFTAWVSATNTVTIRYANNSLTLAQDPASGSFRVSVLKY